MSRIFLSHSSKDNGSAVALRDWLAGQGWDDVFLDLDPQRGIAAGDRWARALNQAVQRCEAVLFLVSRAWVTSDWCLREFNLAHRLNKRLFGLLIENIPVGELPVALTGTWQTVALSSGRDHVVLRAVLPGSHDEVQVSFSQEGLTRLRIGLERAGLDARFFAWPPEGDPHRAPYRGLKSLEAADAGVFFGREAPTVEMLDRIRGIKDGVSLPWLVLLGASGAGKSSFLRAGLLPRLRRDDRNYIPLPVIRPGRGTIHGDTGLARSLESAVAACELSRPYLEVREAVEAGAAGLRPLLRALLVRAREALVAEEAGVKAPLLVFAIDQGEELFLAEGAAEGAALLELLRELSSVDDPAILVLIAIRSDAYEQLQTTKHLEGISQQTVSLTPMPRGAYQAVIEGPATRLKEIGRSFVIEPALTQALLADIDEGGTRDALPLLSFTLERLYLEYGAQDRLTLSDYDALGRITGSIEAAIERALRAADTDSRIPRDRDARLALLRRGLIPWLAGIDPDTGSARRQRARLSEIPDEARPLIDYLVEERLLSIDVSEGTGERTIEAAHEALLRQWGLLKGWLEEDFGVLASLESVKRAARDWAANDRREDWLAHRGSRLEDVERLLLRPDLVSKLDTTDREYLASCTNKVTAERKIKLQEEQERRRLESTLAEATSLPTLRLRSKLLYSAVVLLLTAAALLLRVYDPWFVQTARNFAFDTYQQFDSEPVPQGPTRIVAIDDESLGRIGQWPWPRSVMSDIVNALAGKGAAVIGLDSILAEPDRMSPERIAGTWSREPRSGLSPSANDRALAVAMQSAKVVLALGPSPVKSSGPPSRLTEFVSVGEDPATHLFSIPGTVKNLDILELAAKGVGSTNGRFDLDGLIRRVPLVWKTDWGLAPSLPLEMLRIFNGDKFILIRSDAVGVEQIGLKGIHISTDEHGAVFPRFRVSDRQSDIPVWKLMAGEIGEEDIKDRMILIGATATGLASVVQTSKGALYSVDFYRQILDNILSGRLLWRPSFAIAIELIMTALSAGALALLLLNRDLVSFLVVAFGMEGLILAIGEFAYRQYSMLIDVSYPIAILLIISLVFLVFLYVAIAANRRRASLEMKRSSTHRAA